MRFPDVTASVFFEVPAVAATDVFGHYIFESYADAAALNYARGALFIISMGIQSSTGINALRRCAGIRVGIMSAVADPTPEQVLLARPKY